MLSYRIKHTKGNIFMIYVLNIEGKPLMPTQRSGKVRRLLKEKKAKVIKKCPFTIQLLYETTNYVQEVTLGVDAGSQYIGLSATTSDKVLYEAEIKLRNDITDKLYSRKKYRRNRRDLKKRYRKVRFNNRKKPKGWLAPSVRQKIESHLTVIEKVHQILPVAKIIVETASFDIEKIKNPQIHGIEYQQGEQMGFWNTREYVLARDNHTCQCCKGKTGDKILNVHHIESRKTGGNAPNNLITLCETCHQAYHRGEIQLPENIRRGQRFKDAAFMGIMRWTLYDKLKELYPDVSLTFGYITKNIRIKNNLPKRHYIDARCISGNPAAKPLDYYFFQKKVRCHNRQIHKINTLKGGRRKRNQAEYEVKGFRLFDKVAYQGDEYFIFGRRNSGFFDIRDLQGNKVNKGSVSYKKLKLLEKPKSYLTKKVSVKE